MSFQTNKPEMDWEEAVELCETILDRICDLPEQADDFGQEVGEKVENMQAWIKKHRDVTPKMACALENMQRGVERWFS